MLDSVLIAAEVRRWFVVFVGIHVESNYGIYKLVKACT